MGMFRLLRLFDPLPTRRLDGRFGFRATLTVVVTVTACCSSIASAWVRCLTVLCCSSGSAFTSTLGSVVVIGFTSRALSEETLLHTDLCASKMNSSWFFSSCSCWICSCKAFFFPSHRLTSSCRLSVWSTLLLRHRAAANLFLSLLIFLLSSSSGQRVSSLHPCSLSSLPPGCWAAAAQSWGVGRR